MLSNTEISSIKKLYPGLSLVQKGGKYFIVGELYFCAYYDSVSDALIIKPGPRVIRNDSFIEDQFEIEIELIAGFPEFFPYVREVGGRMEQIVNKYGIKNISDLHVNKDQNNTVCLCPKPAERLRYPNNVDIVHFINSLVVPFFYGLSYYDRYKKWPWNEYSHGDLGIFEFYAENKEKQDKALAKSCYVALTDKGKEYFLEHKNVKGHWSCVCGAGEKFKKCHKKALEGLWALKAILKERAF